MSGLVPRLARAALFAALAASSAFAAYPERPVTLIVPWGAGGGTDATARIIGSLLEKEFGQPVNVVNRTGGSGVVGHSAIAQAAPDGYTIGLITVEIGMMHWQGLTDRHRDRDGDLRGRHSRRADAHSRHACVRGVILGAMLEENFISSMIKSDGNLMGFFTRPIACGLGVLTVVVWLWPVLARLARAR